MPAKPSTAAAKGPRWAELLGQASVKEFGTAVQQLQWTFDAVDEAEDFDEPGLVRAAVAALHSGKSEQILLGSLTVLLAADADPLSAGAALAASDSTYTGLVAALNSSSPLIAAVGARSLCALLASPSKRSREDRQETNVRNRKVGNQLRSMLDLHTRSLVVQEAFADGCCALLGGESVNLGGNAGALFARLWPLAAHSRDDIANAAASAICRLTWLKRLPAGRGGEQQQQQQPLPGAEEAIARACVEFSGVFQAARASSWQSGAPGDVAMAMVQAARLLELVKQLILSGRSGTQTWGNRAVGEEEGIVVLPMGVLIRTITSVFTAVFRQSAVAAKVLSGESRGDSADMSTIVVRTLEVASALAEVAGCALLPHVVQVRGWLDLITEVPATTHWRHVPQSCSFILTLSGTAPSILLNDKIFQRVVKYLLPALRPPERADVQEVSNVVRRKRKASHAFNAPSETKGGSASHWPEVFRSASLVLARFVVLGAPLLRPSEVSSLCQQVVRVLWSGLVAPSSDRVGMSDKGIAADAKGAEIFDCQRLCRDAPSLLALLDLMDSLHRAPHLGATPLSPGLVEALIGLLDLVVAGQPRCAVDHPSLARKCHQKEFLHDAVRSRASAVRDALLSVRSRLPIPSSSTAGITIEWPQEPVYIEIKVPQPMPSLTAVPAEAPRQERPATEPASSSEPPPRTEAAAETAAVEPPSDAAAAAVEPPSEASAVHPNSAFLGGGEAAPEHQDTSLAPKAENVVAASSASDHATPVEQVGARADVQRPQTIEAAKVPPDPVAAKSTAVVQSAVKQPSAASDVSAAKVQVAPVVAAEAVDQPDSSLADQTMELFPGIYEEEDDEPLPQLCLDSPSECLSEGGT